MASITFWTRLEPYTRQNDIDLGLQAQTHDPLWLLARQWQSGEFVGEDSGSPVQARLRLERAPLVRYHPGPLDGQLNLQGQPYRVEIPLEALVEREPVQRAGDPQRDLRLAAEAGLYFLSLLEQAGVPAAGRKAWVTEPAYHLAAPADSAAGQDPAGRGYLAVMARRAPDGFRLYQALRRSLRPGGGNPPGLPDAPAVPPGQQERTLQAGLAYLAWFEARYPAPPAGPQTWNPERMEYAFSVSAAIAQDREMGLVAPEYPGGALDWYAFDLDPQLSLGRKPADPRPEEVVRTLLPTPVRYPGMASDRWWEFEEAAVNFSRVEGDPDELMRLLLVQFALVYSNDWYVMPVELSPGALYRPASLVVTDAFGERTLVPHYSAIDSPPQDWRMFAPSLPDRPVLSPAAGRAGSDAFFLPPVLAASQHSDPIEEVLFMRDELSNLVWAIERLAPGLSGSPIQRAEAYYQRPRPEVQPAGEGEAVNELVYRLASTTPDYWIPFLPVRIQPDEPDVRLRRAATLLEGDGGQPRFSRPLGQLLEPGQPDFSLFEEEVPKSGLLVTRRYQYARWLDGSTFLWLSRAKGAGKGEGSAGLEFDRV